MLLPWSNQSLYLCWWLVQCKAAPSNCPRWLSLWSSRQPTGQNIWSNSDVLISKHSPAHFYRPVCPEPKTLTLSVQRLQKSCCCFRCLLRLTAREFSENGGLSHTLRHIPPNLLSSKLHRDLNLRLQNVFELVVVTTVPSEFWKSGFW